MPLLNLLTKRIYSIIIDRLAQVAVVVDVST